MYIYIYTHIYIPMRTHVRTHARTKPVNDDQSRDRCSATWDNTPKQTKIEQSTPTQDATKHNN